MRHLSDLKHPFGHQIGHRLGHQIGHQIGHPPLGQGRRWPGRGFTLVEMMVVLAVMEVLLAMAGPKLAGFSANSQLNGVKTAFTNAIALARSEAAKRGTSVFLRAKGTPATGNEFAQGWEVIADDDGSGSVSGGDTLVRGFDALPASLKLSGGALLTYRATGYLAGSADQTFLLCRIAGSTEGYRVTVSPSGSADVSAINTCV